MWERERVGEFVQGILKKVEDSEVEQEGESDVAQLDVVGSTFMPVMRE